MNSAVQYDCSSIIQDCSLKHYAQTSTNIGKGERLNCYSSSRIMLQSVCALEFGELGLQIRRENSQQRNCR